MSEAIIEAAEPLASPGELAYERLRTDIVFGRLRPGQRLVLERMRAEYGFGISTLREILNRLTPQGLVTAEGQRGFQVAACSEQDLREIAALRLMLESQALEQSFRLGDVEWEGRIVAAHHKLARLEGALLTGDTTEVQRWKRYDAEFHQSLVSACGSRVLLEVFAGLYDRYLRYQMVFGLFRGKVAADEHRLLLESALSRDTGKAQAILVQHIQGCLAYAFENKLLSPAER